jgi:hypothetical protein
VPKSRSRRRPAPRRPARQGERRQPPPVPTPAAPGPRGAVERRSAPVLVWLTTRPKLLLPLLSLALLVGGFALPPVIGVALLAVLFVVVGWLVYLSWPALQPGGKVIRIVTLALIALGAVSRLLGEG